MAEKKIVWICTVCGYVHEGPEPPDPCPVCGAPREAFEMQEEEVA
jgi:rubrerythrin